MARRRRNSPMSGRGMDQASELNAALSALPLERTSVHLQILENLAVSSWEKGALFGPEICPVAQLLLIKFVLSALMYLQLHDLTLSVRSHRLE